MNNGLLETNIEAIPLLKRGKVRDVFDLGDSLLIVATDRLSAFDVVLPNSIPDKGKVLTQLSLFWYEIMKEIIPNHLVESDVDAFPNVLAPYGEILRGRSMIVKKTEPLPIECVVRGYISGSGWKSYKENRSVCGIELPENLTESAKLPEPIFTPSTKADVGHDINIDIETTGKLIGADVAEKVSRISLEIYRKGSELAAEKGIIIADTKFEFGILDGEILLIDEVLTPDSSRFWPGNQYKPGFPQPSFDKQYVRDYLETLDWDKTYPGPTLPDEIIKNTRKKYIEALRLLTGSTHGL